MHISGLQSHEVRQLVYDELSLRGAFVDPLDAAALPVGPVDEVSQQSEAEDVRKFVLHQNPSARPVHVHHLQGSAESVKHRAGFPMMPGGWQPDGVPTLCVSLLAAHRRAAN